MKRKLVFVVSMLCCTYAFSDERCQVRDAGTGDHCSGVATATSYPKNLPECPQPQSLCATANKPLNASVSCRAIGAGELVCDAYPTSPSYGVLTYNWNITKYSGQSVYSGYGASTIQVSCSENSNHNVQMTVRDMFGRTETIYVSEMCLVGNVN